MLDPAPVGRRHSGQAHVAKSGGRRDTAAHSRPHLGKKLNRIGIGDATIRREDRSGPGIVSNADPRTTFLNLVDPVWLDPSFVLKMRNYRALGVSAKINFALSGLPLFAGVE